MGKRIIYQVLTRLWKNGKFSDWDSTSFKYLKSLSVTHIWFTGVPAHAVGEPFVKGDPGSPYSVSDWFDVNAYLADDPARRMQEFEALVRRAHRNGFKVLTDFIPNHVARSYEGPIPHFDYCDYDWTDTLKVDYSAPGCYEAMLEVLRFWASKGVDGVRCDMVELVPREFFAWAIPKIRAEYPGFEFIGEVYRKENYRSYVQDLGFDLIYDKSGLYDTLRAIMVLPASTKGITWNWQALTDLQPRMLNFLENHDEQRLCSDAFLSGAERSIPALAVAALFNTASFLLYFGQELGENAAEASDGRTSIFNWTRKISPVRLSKEQKSLLERYSTLLSTASEPLFSEGKNWDLGYCNVGSEGYDPNRHFSFLRYAGDECCLVVCNFTDEQASPLVRIPEVENFPAREERVEVAPWDYTIVKL